MAIKLTRKFGISSSTVAISPIFKSNKPLVVKEEHKKELATLTQSVSTCRACPLGSTQHKSRPVIRGAVPCDVLWIGEAPSVIDTNGGQPLIGVMGEVLEEIVAALSTPDLFPNCTHAFTTTVKCLPLPPAHVKDKDHRAPNKGESRTCLDLHLIPLIRLCAPSVIVLVGEVAKAVIPQTDVRIRFVHIRHPASMFRQKDLALEKATAFTAVRDAMMQQGLVF